tara:strand:+ start:20214 stop:22487 length:2274 start_codon:yes stop_codon:yes gene_type:complete
MRPSENFAVFQRAITLGETTEEQLLEKVLKENPSDYRYLHTFHRGLQNKTIDPNTLLINAVIMTVRGDESYLPYVGQALQAGADPNIYAEMVNPGMRDQNGQIPSTIFCHIVTVAWSWAAFDEEQVKENAYLAGTVAPEDIEENEMVNDMMEQSQRLVILVTAMLVLAGADIDMMTTTPKMLIASNINPTRFALEYPAFNMSVRSTLNSRETSGTNLWMDNRDRIQLYSEQRDDMSDVFQSPYINDTAKQSLFNLALYLDHTPILTLEDVYRQEGVMGLLFQFQATNTLLQLVSRWDSVDEILIVQSEPSLYSMDGPAPEIEQVNRVRESDLLNLSLKYFNLSMIDLLLSSGIQKTFLPSNFKTRILADSRLLQYDFPVQAQILNTMIIKIVEYGSGLNVRQYALLNYSQQTQDGVDKAWSMPIWKNSCKTVQADEALAINPDILEISRQINMNLGMTPTEMCKQFEYLSSIPKSSLQQQLLHRQKKLLELQLADVVPVAKSSISESTSRKLREQLEQDNTLSIDEIQSIVQLQQQGKNTDESDYNDSANSSGKVGTGLFANEEILERSVYDYPDIDRVIFRYNGKHWIFTCDNYEDLIENKINPWSQSDPDQYGDPIPDQVLLEMQQKLDLIRYYGLSELPGSITRGVRSLFSSGVQRTQMFYQRDAVRKLEAFLIAMDENGIGRNRFEGITSEEIRDLSEQVLDPVVEIAAYDEDPTLALWDFADAFLIHVDTFESVQEAVSKFPAPKDVEDDEE